jgi:ABC-type glycerol-3-phosphate transport system permease component
LKYSPQMAWLPASGVEPSARFCCGSSSLFRVFAGRADGVVVGHFLARVSAAIETALAALAIFNYLWSANDLLHPLIFLPADHDQTTLTVGLSLFQTQYAGKWTVMMAGALVSIAPVIVVFFAAQKQFIEGASRCPVKK